MIEEFYGLSVTPFRLAPDPRFFFASDTHQKALSYLDYGLRQGEGFVVLTGEIGAGKSTLIDHLMAGLDQRSVAIVPLTTTNLEAHDALRLIGSALRLESGGDSKAHLLAAIEKFLGEQKRTKRRVLLIVDEAQNLPTGTLEELRMLTNLGGGDPSVLQCFLVGQPQFRKLLARPELEQLRQRVIASCHLEPLPPEETRRYIEHRLEVAGWRGRPELAEGVAAAVHEASGGIPRRINLVFGRLLLLGAVEGRDSLDESDVGTVVTDLLTETPESSTAQGAAVVVESDNGGHAPLHALGRLEARVAELERLLVETMETLAAAMRDAKRDKDAAEQGE